MNQTPTDSTLSAALETLHVEAYGRVLLVRFNRPEKRNAMSQILFRELRQGLIEWGGNPEVGAIVLTGSGTAFSAGADLHTFEALQDATAYQAQLDLVEGAFDAVENCAVPVIAAVDGLALAGGLEILLFCDFVMASPNAVFGFSEVLVGLQPVYGLTRGTAVMGRNWTRYLAATGDRIDAETAQAIGVVQRIVPQGELLEEALRIAGIIASRSPDAIREGKRLASMNPPDLANARAAAVRLFASNRHKQAVREFFAARKRRTD
jgi:enoyl-CoA hydratase